MNGHEPETFAQIFVPTDEAVNIFLQNCQLLPDYHTNIEAWEYFLQRAVLLDSAWGECEVAATPVHTIVPGTGNAF